MAKVIDQITAFDMFRGWWDILGDNVDDVAHIRKTIMGEQTQCTPSVSSRILSLFNPKRMIPQIYTIEEGMKHHFFEHVRSLIRFDKFHFQNHYEKLPSVLKNIVDEYIGIESMIDDVKNVIHRYSSSYDIKYPHPEICLAYLFNNPAHIKHIKNLSPELCLAAILLDRNIVFDGRNKLLHLLADSEGNTKVRKTQSELKNTISFRRKNRFHFDQENKANLLPLPLSNLTIGEEFDREVIENLSPPNLSSLTFGEEFDQGIKEKLLPLHLSSLTFGE